MEPIQSVSSGYVPSTRPAQTSNAAASESVTSASFTQSSVTAISMSESVSAAAVSQNVENFLGSINPALGNNAYLKLLIAALIMQVLLGEDGGAQQSGAGLQGLEALSGGRNNLLFVSIESSTNTVQLEQQSYRLDLTSAVQSLTESANGSDAPGRQMDVSA